MFLANKSVVRTVSFLNLGVAFYEAVSNLLLTHNLKAAGEKTGKDTKVLYDDSLKHLVLFPTMINISHFYAYYAAYNRLRKAMDDNVYLGDAIDDMSVLDLCLSQA